MLVILSPSKTQTSRRTALSCTLPLFPEKTRILAEHVKSFSQEELGKRMGISEKLAATTYQAYRQFEAAPAPDKGTPALLAFRGDVYAPMDVDNYSDDDFAFAQHHLCILSGLYGLLRPLDLIQPYRLEMGGKISPENYSNLYDFWRREVTGVLSEALAASGSEELLNLASGEYFKVIDTKALPVPVVEAVFKQKREGKLRTVAIHAKKARGALADFIIANRIRCSADLHDFHHDGYRYDAKQSTPEKLFFLRRE